MMLHPATPFTLADVMEMVVEFSKPRTSHPAITATPVNHGFDFVPPDAATVPTPGGPEPMHLTVPHTNTGCYRCNDF